MRSLEFFETTQPFPRGEAQGSNLQFPAQRSQPRKTHINYERPYPSRDLDHQEVDTLKQGQGLQIFWF
jgi:hypothetical protein